eukprot:scaffold166696_cov31-Tisochrysis_lutea.AAC.1
MVGCSLRLAALSLLTVGASSLHVGRAPVVTLRRAHPLASEKPPNLRPTLGEGRESPPPLRPPTLPEPASAVYCFSRQHARCARPLASEKPPDRWPTTLGEAASTVYRFSRPHTIRGTLLACATGVGKALIESPEQLALLPTLLPRAMLGVLALVLGNLFIVGINQIYDVEIDLVNKPFLPIAAGVMSPAFAWAVVCASGDLHARAQQAGRGVRKF